MSADAADWVASLFVAAAGLTVLAVALRPSRPFRWSPWRKALHTIGGKR